MSNDLFTKSLKQTSSAKKFNRHIHLEIFARKKFESEGFRKKVESIESNIDFLDDNIKKSVLSEDNLFTNYLSENTPVSITGRIGELFDNPTIINNIRVDTVNMTDKVKNCISLYNDISEEENPEVFKSQLLDPFGEQTGVRVYVVVLTVEIGKKAEYKIVLIDPFHLVIPSEYDGRKKEIVERENFELNRNNTTCMTEYMSSIYS